MVWAMTSCWMIIYMCISGAFKFMVGNLRQFQVQFSMKSHILMSYRDLFLKPKELPLKGQSVYSNVLCEVLQVCKMGKALGIDSNLPHELSLSLGGCEVRICLVSQIIFSCCSEDEILL